VSVRRAIASIASLGFAVAVASAPACGGGGAPSVSAPTRSLPPKEGEPLAFDVEDGDVWSWQVHLRGHAPRGTLLARCHVEGRAARAAVAAAGARFSTTLALEPGDNVAAVVCEDDAGAVHRSPSIRLRARLRDAPTARIAGQGPRSALTLDASSSEPARRDGAPLVSFAWLDEQGHALGTGPRLGPLARGPRRRVRLVVGDGSGRSDVTSVIVNEGAIAPRAAAWIDDAIVYGVVPPRFGDPPLRAVTRALGSIADLGATVVWLTPIFESPEGDFGYAVTDYGEVRRAYGSAADLDALVAEAHRLGLRVLLDWVPNHTSDLHPYFVESARLGPGSRRFGFYVRDGAGAPVHYFDWANLPNLDYGRPEVARFVTAESAEWLRGHHVDGFRVDAAWGIRERSPSFYDEWTAEMRRVEPDAMLLAEASARDPFYLAHGFDAAYDWTDRLGEAAWAHVFDDPALAADRLEAAVRASAEHGPASRVLRFLDNNDTGARFVTRHGAERTRVAAAALLTLPGIPCLFTGDEVGAEYEPYGAPGVIERGDPHGLRPHYRALARLRRERPSLRSATVRRVEVAAKATSPGGSILAMWRGDAASGESTLVVLHFGDAPVVASVQLGASAPRAERFVDRLTGRVHRASAGTLRLALPPNTALVLAPGG
jgi:hypothetical protein